MFPNLRAEMARLKITLKYLVEHGVKCTISTLSLKLNGKAPMDLDTMLAIQKALGSEKTLDWLFARG